MIKKLLKQIKKEKTILHLNGDPLLYRNHLVLLGNIPIVLSYRGVIQLPSTRLFSHTKNMPSKLNHLKDYYFLKKTINKIDYITYQNSKNLDNLKNIYRGPLQKVTSGCDFSFWHSQDRRVSRQRLGLPVSKKIFFSASLLIDLKQIDKLISIFTQLSNRYDFLLIIAGHGFKKYEDYLKSISVDLLKEDKIRFVGFLSGQIFRSYYNASDFFISASKQEGGPVSAMQAFACEIPVILTKTGHAAELMEQYNCGCLLDIHDVDMWRNKIEEILNGDLLVKPLDREVAKNHYDWQNIACRFLSIYESLVRKYYS